MRQRGEGSATGGFSSRRTLIHARAILSSACTEARWRAPAPRKAAIVNAPNDYHTRVSASDFRTFTAVAPAVTRAAAPAIVPRTTSLILHHRLHTPRAEAVLVSRRADGQIQIVCSDETRTCSRDAIDYLARCVYDGVVVSASAAGGRYSGRTTFRRTVCKSTDSTAADEHTATRRVIQ